MIMKKGIFTCFIALAVCFATLLVTDSTYASEITLNDINYNSKATLTYDSNGVRTYTTNLTDKELEQALNEQVEKKTQEINKSAQKNNPTMRSTSRPVYTVVYGPKKYANAPYHAIEGQPSGGYQFNTGGLVNVNNKGGSSFSFSVSFNTPFGSLGVSATPGKATGTVTGYSARIPSSKKQHYKVYASNTYYCTPIIYYKDKAKKHVYLKTAVGVLYSTSVSVRKVN